MSGPDMSPVAAVICGLLGFALLCLTLWWPRRER